MKIWQQILTILAISFCAAAISSQLKPIDLTKVDPLAIKASEYYQKEEASVIILDVRSIEKYEQGHITGAIHFPVEDWENSLAVIFEHYTGKETIFAYCDESCGTSKNVVERLREAGLENCFFIHNGYSALTEAKEKK